MTSLESTPVHSDTDSQQGTKAHAKAILADRYKTRLCRNFTETHECPYETRCMFAHGEEDLRTPEENYAQGLTSEESIRAHQKLLARKAATVPIVPSAQRAPARINVPHNGHHAYARTQYTHSPYYYNEYCDCSQCIGANYYPEQYNYGGYAPRYGYYPAHQGPYVSQPEFAGPCCCEECAAYQAPSRECCQP